MDTKVAVRRCKEYDPDEVYKNISDIYSVCNGPDVANKKVLVKPNILIDTDSVKCVTTHPVVVEAIIRFLRNKGASILVGDSPAIHFRGFKSEKSGIYQVCQKTGALWVDFMKDQAEMPFGRGKIKIASADLFHRSYKKYT